MTAAVALNIGNSEWIKRFDGTRAKTVALCAPLSADDMNLQAAVFASPPKWHLAHVTWFFEAFLLLPHLSGYEPFDLSYHRIFNSYYVGAGPLHARGQRGLLSRPTLDEVMAYRRHVDQAMMRLIARRAHEPAIAEVLWVGLQHEEQHQELLLTDLKYALSFNPLLPAYRSKSSRACVLADAPSPLHWLPLPIGVHTIGASSQRHPERSEGSFATLRMTGASDDGRSFDNERPAHRVFIEPVALGSRLITNREYRAFMEDDGYKRAELWLSEGWDWVRRSDVEAPLYWLLKDDTWHEYTLDGLRPMVDDAPVTHVNYYEADAYARWAKARLPGEAEWEVAARARPIEGNFLETGLLHPAAAENGALQFHGDTWEWTLSHYGPYPGFQPYEGVMGEYNGKFMCGQFVLRGGSCASPQAHLRSSYRNFFPPESRWQFSGIRLAKDQP